MKGLIELFRRDIGAEGFTRGELFRYGVLGPLWIVAVCALGGWIGG